MQRSNKLTWHRPIVAERTARLKMFRRINVTSNVISRPLCWREPAYRPWQETNFLYPLRHEATSPASVRFHRRRTQSKTYSECVSVSVSGLTQRSAGRPLYSQQMQRQMKTGKAESQAQTGDTATSNKDTGFRPFNKETWLISNDSNYPVFSRYR